MKVGLYYDLRNPPAWRRPWPELYARTLERIEEAERLGLSCVWITEHHLFEDGYMPQPLLFAAAVAARTRRVRVGTAVTIAPLRPALDLAEQAALVDLLSGGRLELGLGAGYRVPEFEAYGVDFQARYDLLELRAREVAELWDRGRLSPPPVQGRAPLWIGANGPRGARLAGRLGAGLLWLGRRGLPPYLEGLREGGHDPARARLGGVVGLILADDPEAAWPRIAPHLAYQRESYNRYGAEGRRTGEKAALPISVEAEVGPVDPEQLRRPPSGGPPLLDVVTPDDAIAQVRRLGASRPASDVYLWASVAGMPDDLADRHQELVAGRLAPALAAGSEPDPGAGDQS